MVQDVRLDTSSFPVSLLAPKRNVMAAPWPLQFADSRAAGWGWRPPLVRRAAASPRCPSGQAASPGCPSGQAGRAPADGHGDP
jgi:hypothetical protein